MPHVAAMPEQQAKHFFGVEKSPFLGWKSSAISQPVKANLENSSQSFQPNAHFIGGRIVPASIDRKLVNNDDMPHGREDDIFDPRTLRSHFFR